MSGNGDDNVESGWEVDALRFTTVPYLLYYSWVLPYLADSI